MAYCDYTDVYRVTGLSSTEASTANVTSNISEAEILVCRTTKNIYWQNIVTSTVTTATSATLTSASTSWVTDAYKNMYAWVYSGTGTGQIRQITTNSSTALTLDRNWTTLPVVSDGFKIFYVPSDFNPYKSMTYNGNSQVYFYLSYYPIKLVESLSINTTSVTPSNLYLYEFTGRIELKSGAEAGKFSSSVPQDISVSYWYGVDYLPTEVKRLVEIEAGILTLQQFLGGSFGNPESVNLPEFTITTPGAYTVASKTLDVLNAERERLKHAVKVWPVFG
jgi:hypothetical protein